MIELNKQYSTKALAQELNISYNQLRKVRDKYEEHLKRFYEYKIIHKGNNGVYYIFTEEKGSYLSLRNYTKLQKNNTITTHIKSTIHFDPRQTGSNIARIIMVDGEIQALDLQLSTLKVYVREQLKGLVENGFYVKEDYKWCYLDKLRNKYVLMTEKEINNLRSYFKTRDSIDQEADIWAKQKEGELTKQEAYEQVGEIRYHSFLEGLKVYQNDTGIWPMKVPVYVRNAFVGED